MCGQVAEEIVFRGKIKNDKKIVLTRFIISAVQRKRMMTVGESRFL